MKKAEQDPVAGQGQYQGSRQRVVRGKPRSVSKIKRARSETSQVSNWRSVIKSGNQGQIQGGQRGSCPPKIVLTPRLSPSATSPYLRYEASKCSCGDFISASPGSLKVPGGLKYIPWAPSVHLEGARGITMGVWKRCDTGATATRWQICSTAVRVSLHFPVRRSDLYSTGAS